MKTPRALLLLLSQRFGLVLHEKVPSAEDFEKQYIKAFCSRIEKKNSKEFTRLKIFKSMSGELLGLLQVRLAFERREFLFAFTILL